MSLGHNARLTQFLALLDRGEVHRARQGAKTVEEWARRLGMTRDQLRGAQRSAKAIGLTVPQWGDGSQYENDRTQNANADCQPQPVTDDGLRPDSAANESYMTRYPALGVMDDSLDSEFDFSEEEPTVEQQPIADVRQQQIVPLRTSGIRDPFTRHLTRAEVPDGSVIAVLSDIHIPHHDVDAVRLAIECCERIGATHVILNGDIADCGPASRHPDKRAQALFDEGDLRASVEPGRWIYDWARTKRCLLVRGNHEAWVERSIRTSAEMRGSTPEQLMGLPEDGDGWEVLPALSRIRLGSRVWEHLDGFFKSGNGGQNPGARIQKLAPDQTTSGGHLHRKGSFFWTTLDEEGVSRTRAAFWNGHLSKPEAHHDYMGSYFNWQQSFEITRVWYDDDRPRFTTDQPEIHRDKNGRPIFEYQGVIYR